VTLYSGIEHFDSLHYIDSAWLAALTEQRRTMEPVQTGKSAFDIALNKAEMARRVALSAPGLTPARATAAHKAYLQAVITAGVLYEIATPNEMAALKALIGEKPVTTHYTGDEWTGARGPPAARAKRSGDGV
jgi:hypothetical protein